MAHVRQARQRLNGIGVVRSGSHRFRGLGLGRVSNICSITWPGGVGGINGLRWAIALCSPSLHNAIMTSITIRDVPESARDELAGRAAASGRSLQEYLRAHLIDLAERPDAAVLLKRIRHRKQQTGSSLDALAILAERDADRT